MTEQPPPAQPSTFYQELHEITGDLVPDLSQTFMDMDPAVGRRIQQYVMDLFKKSAGDAGILIRDLHSAMLWWFMVGREHALRGYPSPVGKSDTTDEVIPDTPAEMWEDDGWDPDDPSLP